MEDKIIEYIARNLVNNPDEVTVNRKESGKNVILELHVAQEDMGRVIGKDGRVANAMRALLRAVADKDRNRRRIVLEIE